MKNRKTVKVVMLPTEDKGALIYNTYINPEKHKSNPLQELNSHLYNGDSSKIEPMGYKYQHLYLTSDEEIKEGDWVIYKGRIVQASIKTQLRIINITSKKIIATTDKSLEISLGKPYKADMNTIIHPRKQLPQIPQSFIEAYVKAEGKIDEVQVEMEQYGTPEDPITFRVKLDEFNAVTIIV